ncbi:hypothetical protein CDO52_12870 [Nocardiopsis gilva YIM 90087]|uniref:Uncharacterized protein n=1 Tax=Nocardiopsis gilva YIM 90087 TaxID=1235441 RepID=A0A223S634_9ACTN|nr:hypothetical protein [Nocardiopsis gilva]ASU83561.1 hypothetical protein CDO52_12870 [Nocardiopsis gilva YIM 90087]
MSTEVSKCTRCTRAVPTEPPREGVRYRLRMTTTTHILRFSIWRFRWMPAHPADRVQTTYTDLTLCDTCAADVLAFAQGKET